jgi:hypothetical protein
MRESTEHERTSLSLLCVCMDRRGFWHPVPELLLFALERFFFFFPFLFLL